MRVVLRREADQELVEAAFYYESLQRGLGAAFLAEAEDAFGWLARYPRRWRVIRGDVRRGCLRRFPYVFHYWEKVPGEEVEILSVSHSKRHPLYWNSRHDA